MADNSIPTAYDPVVQLLEDAAAGAVVVLTVTGRNSAGESPASDAVEFQVP